jgi:hypothetical protein
MKTMDLSFTLDLLSRPFHKVKMVHRAQSLPMVRVAAVVSIALVLASCASVQHTVGGWFGAATPTPTPATAAQAPRVYYAGVEGMRVYSDPSPSSKVVGELSLHERVTRTKLERGFAFVESAKSGTKGWVKNEQLIWRLPTAPTTAAPAGAEPQPAEPEAPAAEEPLAPVTPEATATAPEALPTATPVPATPPTPKATPRGVSPSIFNPY